MLRRNSSLLAATIAANGAAFGAVRRPILSLKISAILPKTGSRLS
jgi:hypothetical protein